MTGYMGRALVVLTLFAVSTGSLTAQASGAARADYLLAVAAFFNLPPNEVHILSDWEVAADEIPVVLFMARRAGVSPEALVALRESGQGWAVLSERYRVHAPALHVPIPDSAPAGRLESAYRQYRSTPVVEWTSIRLTDDDIIALVNVRFISQSLKLPAERVLANTVGMVSFVELHARLRR